MGHGPGGWHTDPTGGTRTPRVTPSPGPRTALSAAEGPQDGPCQSPRGEYLLPDTCAGGNTMGVPCASLGTGGGCASLMPTLAEPWLRGPVTGLV